jgi:hypothetical protein
VFLGEDYQGITQGKAKSFVCMEDVHSVEDLKKPKHPDAKKKEETIS